MTDAPTAVPHPEEMSAGVELALPGGATFRATARATPAGLICAAILVSAIILSVVPLVAASRRRIG